MRRAPVYSLSALSLTFLHTYLEEEYPDIIRGVKSWGLFHSALSYPDHAVFGFERYTTVVEKAAAYLYAITNFHPFNDGNKRTAFFAMLYHLGRNGWHYEVSVDRDYRMMVDIAEDKEWDSESVRRLAFRIKGRIH